MPKLSTQALAERRLHIMTSAFRCFEQHGLATSTVDQICAEAKISKGAFYTHFDSKDGLIQTMMEHRNAAVSISCHSLSQFKRMMVDVLLSPSYVGTAARIDLEAIAISSSEPTLRRLLSTNTERLREQLSQNIANFKESRQASTNLEAEAVADILLSYILGKIAIQIIDPKELSAAEKELFSLIDLLITPFELQPCEA